MSCGAASTAATIRPVPAWTSRAPVVCSAQGAFDEYRPRGGRFESGHQPTFFFEGGRSMTTIQADIEARLAQAEPEVEVLLAEVVGGGTVRLFIDHPAGVSHELCERVTRHLT